MKKVWILALISCLLLTAVAGCGGGESPATEAPATEAPTAAQTPALEPEASETAEPTEVPTEEPGFVTVSLPLTEENVTFTYLNAINPQTAAYFDTYSDISVYRELGARTGVYFDTMDIPMPAMSEQFSVLLAADDLPDYVNNGNEYYSGGALAAVEEGVFVNIADYLDACPNYAYLLSTDETIYKTAYCADNIIGAFWQLLSEPQFESGYVIRGDWLAETGLDVPTTYDEWYEVLTALKNAGYAGAYGFQGGDGGDTLFAAGMGVNCFTGARSGESQFSLIDGVVSFTGVEDSYLDYLTLMNQWYSEGLIYADSAMLSSTSQTYMINNALQESEVGLAVIEKTNISAYEELIDGAEFIPVPQPTETGTEEIHYSRYGSRVQTSNYCVTTNCEDPELLIRFIDYMYSEEGSFLCNWGLDGEAHVLDDAGNPQWTELVYANPDGLSVDFAASLYALDMGPFMEDAHRYDSVLSESELEAGEVWATNVDNAWMYPAYIPIPVDDALEFSVLWNDIGTYIQESFFKFVNGEMPLSSWDTYVETIQGMNLERCIEIYQDAYDAYNS